MWSHPAGESEGIVEFRGKTVEGGERQAFEKEGKEGQILQIRTGQVWAGPSLRAWPWTVLSGNLPPNH